MLPMYLQGWLPVVYKLVTFTYVVLIISVSFGYRIYPFKTFQFFCSCIRCHWPSDASVQHPRVFASLLLAAAIIVTIV